MNKSISIIVPVRNEEINIKDCIISLLNQNYPKEKYEIIIVDGHSSDGTLEALSKFPVKIIEDDGKGVSAARNKGVSCAEGEIVAFTDGDCIATPDWIRNLAKNFDDFSVGGVGGALRTRNLGSLLTLCEDLNTRATYKGFIAANVAYRKDIINEVGGFNPNIKCGEDWDLWWRVLDRGYRVPFESSAVVIHGPSENRGWASYYKKEFWYARMDVKVFIKRARLVLANELRVGKSDSKIASTWFIMRQTIVHASIVSLFLASLLLPYLLYVGLGVLLLRVGRRTLLAFDLLPAEAFSKKISILSVFAAYTFMKVIVRGSGTLVGLIECALSNLKRIFPQTPTKILPF